MLSVLKVFRCQHHIFFFRFWLTHVNEGGVLNGGGKGFGVQSVRWVPSHHIHFFLLPLFLIYCGFSLQGNHMSIFISVVLGCVSDVCVISDSAIWF